MKTTKNYKIAFVSLSIVIAGVIATWKLLSNLISNRKYEKFKMYYELLNQWLMLKQKGILLEEYFLKKGYGTIAIYGMGEIGNRLYDELINTNIVIKYGIDKSNSNPYNSLEIKNIDSELEPVDIVVVSAVYDYYDIEELLKSKVDIPIVSLESIIFSL